MFMLFTAALLCFGDDYSLVEMTRMSVVLLGCVSLTTKGSVGGTSRLKDLLISAQFSCEANRHSVQSVYNCVKHFVETMR